MERSDLDQAVDLLTRSSRGVLLIVPPDPSVDALASLLALALALVALEKTPTLVSPSFIPEHLQFLPGTSQVRREIVAAPSVSMEVPLGDRRLRNLRWEVLAGRLLIAFESEDPRPFPETTVRTKERRYPWDAVVTLGAPSLHALGPAFTDHTDFFYATPTLNIDRGTVNELFGAVNLVPTTTSTIAEVIFGLLDALGGVRLLTPETATCLFTGLLAGSDAFRSTATTPQTFQVASRLLEQDADQQTVVRNLFKTHAPSELRLLGRALTRLEELPSGALCAVVTTQDLEETDTTAESLPAVLKDIREWTGERRMIFLAFERTTGETEALIAPGRMSADDRENFREALSGVRAGPFILVNLGAAEATEGPRLITERILPRLPQPPATFERISGNE